MGLLGVIHPGLFSVVNHIVLRRELPAFSDVNDMTPLNPDPNSRDSRATGKPELNAGRNMDSSENFCNFLISGL